MESVEYLRKFGCLDETNPSRPSVIVPNYINAPSNFVLSTDIYSVVCYDECEPIMVQVEQKVAAPSATPTEIAAVVQGIPSASVTAPRKLPASLLQHLEEIAKIHAGQVPLHGRLFAQWMHHAYPKECPYPQPPGSTELEVPTETSELRHIVAPDSEIEKSEKQLEEAQKSPKSAQALEQCLPWTMEEELVAPLMLPEMAVQERRLSITGVRDAMLTVPATTLYIMLCLPLVVATMWVLTRYRPLGTSKASAFLTNEESTVTELAQRSE